MDDLHDQLAQLQQRLDQMVGFQMALLMGLKALQAQEHYSHERFLEALMTQQALMERGIGHMATAAREQLEAILQRLSGPAVAAAAPTRALS